MSSLRTAARASLGNLRRFACCGVKMDWLMLIMERTVSCVMLRVLLRVLWAGGVCRGGVTLGVVLADAVQGVDVLARWCVAGCGDTLGDGAGGAGLGTLGGGAVVRLGGDFNIVCSLLRSFNWV